MSETAALDEELRKFFQMGTQVDDYLQAMKNNINGSSAHWGVSESIVTEAYWFAHTAQTAMTPAVQWAKNAAAIGYHPNEQELARLRELCISAARDIDSLDMLFTEKIYPVAPPEWTVKMKNYLKVSDSYLEQIFAMLRSEFVS